MKNVSNNFLIGSYSYGYEVMEQHIATAIATTKIQYQNSISIAIFYLAFYIDQTVLLEPYNSPPFSSCLQPLIS